MELLQDSANELETYFIETLKGHFQGQVWLIFTYLPILIKYWNAGQVLHSILA